MSLLRGFSCSRLTPSLLAGRLKNAAVDEICLAAFHLAQDVMHLLSGAKAIVVYPLALATGTFPGTTPTFLFLFLLNLCVKLHDVKKLVGTTHICHIISSAT